MATKKKPTAARLDLNFMDMMNPSREFTVMGLTVNARALVIENFAELKQMFPKWQSFEVTELLNSGDSLEAFASIIWMGVRDGTPELEEKANVFYAVNLRTLSEWQPVMEYISGIQYVSEDDAETTEPPDPKASGNGS